MNVHGGLAGLTRALAINAVLTDEDECVCQDIERYGEASPWYAHHEFVFFEFLAAVVIDAHTVSLAGEFLQAEIPVLDLHGALVGGD